MAMFTIPSVRHDDYVAKAGCYTCLKDTSDKHGPLVDFDISIEGEGRLAICAQCLAEAAHLLGWTEPHESEELRLRLNDANRALDAMSKKLSRRDSVLQAQAEYFKAEHKAKADV